MSAPTYTAAEKKKALKDIDELIVEASDPFEIDALLDQRIDVMHAKRTVKKPEFKSDKAMSK